MMELDPEIACYYEHRYDEGARLGAGPGAIELLRTQQIISRHLGDRPLRIADIGGGPGVYARWLAELGHDVVLVDPIERHVEAARSIDSPGSIEAMLGDARDLTLTDEDFDVVLLLGPLYHLQDPADRKRALSEALRVLRPDGRLFAAAISRFASLHDGLSRGALFQPDFAGMVDADLETGRHLNPGGEAQAFTTAYFHRPEELGEEMGDAGLIDIDVVGLEGLAAWLPALGDPLSSEENVATLLAALARVESEPSLLGVSPHLLGHGVKPG